MKREEQVRANAAQEGPSPLLQQRLWSPRAKPFQAVSMTGMHVMGPVRILSPSWELHSNYTGGIWEGRDGKGGILICISSHWGLPAWDNERHTPV